MAIWRPTTVVGVMPTAAWIQTAAHLQPRHPGIQVRFSDDYIRRWVPELRRERKDLLSGEIQPSSGGITPNPW